MPHDFYVFVREPGDDQTVRIAHDSGWQATAMPGTAPDGRGGWYFRVPTTVPERQGAQLDLAATGKVMVSVRGLLTYQSDGRAYLQCDDFTMVDVPAPLPPEPEPPEPQPPSGPPSSMTSPLDRINWWYNTGQFNLVSKEGCGQFTEAVCTDFHVFYGPQWAHVKKTPGQNQYRCHAVDALQSIGGEHHGIWDIITSSASTSARPAFNRAGDAKPELYCYPAERCCQGHK